MNKTSEIQSYYKTQSKFYDLTRPIFLFGRNKIVDQIVKSNSTGNLLEIGCGTGYILNKLKAESSLNLYGIDISNEMLEKAERKLGDNAELSEISLLNYYPEIKFDIIILSYVFTLNIDETKLYIEKIKSLLKKGGMLYVVDFHKPGNSIYNNFMKRNHINIDPTLLAELKNNFSEVNSNIHTSYFGLWKYFTFEGANDWI